MDYRLISIGTLAAHPLWKEGSAVRTGHATTTLVTAGAARILVDPSLPAPALVARLSERSDVGAGEITHIFLTSFQAERRRALPAFPQATCLLWRTEREAAQAGLQSQLEHVEADDDDLAALLRRELATLEGCEDAADSIVGGVDLFPLPGVTPGTCGLLLSRPGQTVLICGDAVATTEHLEQGKVLPNCTNVEQAQESFREAVQIADVLVPGRDNVLLNPLRAMML